MRLSRLILIFSEMLLLASCATTRIPAKGEPIRVGATSEGTITMRELPLEQYVAGVLAKEVPTDWPIEVLKAQAVATRTYAVYRKLNPRDKRFDVTADTNDQVFESKSRHGQNIARAVMETEGEVLASDGKVFETFFHSCCGGTTESADEVWPGRHPEPLLSIRDDPYCNACPPNHWDYTVSREQLAGLLRAKGYPVDVEWTLEAARKDASGRVQQIALKIPKQKPILIPGAKFRQIVGYTNLKSTLFDLLATTDEIVFTGRGAGHGVGLCQWGAKGMADEGKSYREILEFYYPGADLQSPRHTTSTSEPVSQEKAILQDLQGSD